MGILERVRQAVAPDVSDVRSLFNEQAYNTSFGLPRAPTNTGVLVTEQVAESVAAFWRAVNLVATVVSNFPLHQYRETNGIATQVTSAPIVQRPYPNETRKDTVSGWVVDLLYYGNAFGVLADFDERGYPRVVVPVHPKNVTVRQSKDDGQVLYQVGGPSGEVYSTSEVLHIKAFHNSGEVVGRGVLSAQHDTVGHAFQQNRFSQTWFSQGGAPTGAIKVGSKLSPEQKAQLREQWSVFHSNSRQPAVLDEGQEWVEYGWNNRNNQLLEARQFSVAEIANAVGVPSYFLNAPVQGMTYSNVEQEGLNLLKYSVIADVYPRIEQAFTDLLPRGTWAKFNVDSILRSDTKTRAETLAIEVSHGWRTVNEVRQLLDLPPLAEPEPPAADATGDTEDA